MFKHAQRFYYSFAYLVLLGLPSAVVIWFVSLDAKALVVLVLLALIIGGGFDIWAVRQSRRDEFFIWEYNSKSIIGFKIFGVPIEDYIFFLVLTPVFLVSFYEAIKKMLALNQAILVFALAFGTLALVVSYLTVYHHAIKSKR